MFSEKRFDLFHFEVIWVHIYAEETSLDYQNVINIKE